MKNIPSLMKACFPNEESQGTVHILNFFHQMFYDNGNFYDLFGFKYIEVPEVWEKAHNFKPFVYITFISFKKVNFQA